MAKEEKFLQEIKRIKNIQTIRMISANKDAIDGYIIDNQK